MLSLPPFHFPFELVPLPAYSMRRWLPLLPVCLCVCVGAAVTGVWKWGSQPNRPWLTIYSRTRERSEADVRQA